MSVQYPYRAVICAEEHIVKCWLGENLFTDKGEYVFRRLRGKQVTSEWAGTFSGGLSSDEPIQSIRLLEVAMLQSDGAGGWLINGHNLFWPLQSPPANYRLTSIVSSEVLRVHKKAIHAVAWVQSISVGSITSQLDTVLADWKKVQQGKTNQTHIVSDDLSLSLFAGWSQPIWLTEFHPVDVMTAKPTKARIVTANALAEYERTKAELHRAMATAERNQGLVGIKNVPAQAAGAPEYFTNIETASKYVGVTKRTILNWKKRGWLKVEQNGKKIRIAKTSLDNCKIRQ